MHLVQSAIFISLLMSLYNISITPRSGLDWVLWYSGGDVTLVQPNFELRQHNELLLHVLTKHCYAPLPPSPADRGLMVDRWGYILASLYHCNKSVVSSKIFSTIVTVPVHEDVVVARIKRCGGQGVYTSWWVLYEVLYFKDPFRDGALLLYNIAPISPSGWSRFRVLISVYDQQRLSKLFIAQLNYRSGLLTWQCVRHMLITSIWNIYD